MRALAPADLQAVFCDFELDLEATLPQHWQQLLKGSTADAGSISPHSVKLRSRLLSLMSLVSSSGGNRGGVNRNNSSSSRPGSPQGSRGPACDSGVDAGLPSTWAGKLQAVLEVLGLVGQERRHVWNELQAAQQRVQLLETNVQEVRAHCASTVTCVLFWCLSCSKSQLLVMC
jgi:hypothetical protein